VPTSSLPSQCYAQNIHQDEPHITPQQQKQKQKQKQQQQQQQGPKTPI
jgi:hypothetical protein